MRNMCIQKAAWGVMVALVLTLSVGTGLAKEGMRLDPMDYTALPALTATAGTLEFDTDTAVLTIDSSATSNGLVQVSPSGKRNLAIFCFESIDIGSGVTVSFTGANPVVLMSQGTTNIAADLATGLTGGPGTVTAGVAGPGGVGGWRGVFHGETPSDAVHGPGFARQEPSTPGAGAGGGYGGRGVIGWGAASWNYVGKRYGDKYLTEIYGGSGGAPSDAAGGVTGSGGGGAIAIYSSGAMTISGTIDTSGGDGPSINSGVSAGGGGSGGAILLNAPSIDLSGATLDASGGDGSFDTGNGRILGGGGGGGRIAIYYTDSFTPGTHDVTGGDGDPDSSHVGEPGTLFIADPDATGATVAAGTKGSRLDPSDFSASTLGALNPSTSLVFDTDVCQVSVDGGGALDGIYTRTEAGDIVAAFCFDSINIGAGVGVSFVGDYPIALLSLGTTDIAADISTGLAGGDSIADTGLPTDAGAAGVGGWRGGVYFDRMTPEMHGPGVAQAVRWSGGSSGSGPGHGGRGLPGWGTPAPYRGGSAYGDVFVSSLLGGSGGNYGINSGTPGIAGAGGGGAIGIFSVGDMTVSGSIDASGGDGRQVVQGITSQGGGGSGGAIVLEAPSVDLSGGTLDASGGDGSLHGAGRPLGGGGAGGRVAIYTEAYTDGTVTLDGGEGDPNSFTPNQADPGTVLVARSDDDPIAAAEGSRFDPADFTSAGGFTFSGSETFVFDTDALILTSGTEDLFIGELGVSASGDAEVAVFCFDEIDLSGSVSVTVQGSRPIALVSAGAIDIGVAIDGLAGSDGAAETYGLLSAVGAAGAGGWRGSTLAEDMSDAFHGPGHSEKGPGVWGDNWSGTGASYGGQGIIGFQGQTIPVGPTYGDAKLSDLMGGSGGVAGSASGGYSTTGGGGAGGIALISDVSVTVGATLDVSGGEGGATATSRIGGGGSGGAILIDAPVVDVSAGTLDASGGWGGAYTVTPGRYLGGAGGGGRIAIYCSDTYSSGTINLAGGESDFQDGVNPPRFKAGDGTLHIEFPQATSAVSKPGTVGSRFDPADFTTHGDLTFSGSETIIFDTDYLTVDTGSTIMVAGEAVLSESGLTTVSVFAFDSISLTGSVNVQVQGSRPIALVSPGNIEIGVEISGLAGGIGAADSGPAAAGTAGIGGWRGGSQYEAMSDAIHGPGHGRKDPADPNGSYAGAGAGYGGAGLPGWSLDAAYAGPTYGDEMLTELWGGSGGCAGLTGYTGGGGGGALALISDTNVTVSSTITLSGGEGGVSGGPAQGGGGGSGGALLIDAPTVDVSAAYLDVSGANGSLRTSDEYYLGGGGGGGRIAIYTENALTLGGMDLAGGQQGPTTARVDAGEGTFYTQFPDKTPVSKPGTVGSRFDPADFTPSTALVYSGSETLVFDTDELTLYDGSSVNPVGEVVLTESGSTEVAVFAFTSIDLGASVSVSITGSRAISLLSTGNIAIACDLSDGLVGGNGSPGTTLAVAGTAGAGGWRGAYKAETMNATDHGAGHGLTTGTTVSFSGSGAGYGGAGLESWSHDDFPGGSTYGDKTLTELWGGSGGAWGNSNTNPSNSIGGGGGGGAISIIADGNVTLSGTVNCSGGTGSSSVWGVTFQGGGGSGGGILIDGATVDLSGGTLDVTGGDGGYHLVDRPIGGGGGGGRVAIYADSYVPGEILYEGGLGDHTLGLVQADPGTVYFNFAETTEKAYDGSRFDPTAFTAMGALNYTGEESLVFDTDTALLIVDDSLVLPGYLTTSASGSTDIAAFCFSSVNLGTSVTVSFTGSNPAALLSQGTMTIACDLADGLAGGDSSGTTAGTAATGGWRGGVPDETMTDAIHGPGHGPADPSDANGYHAGAGAGYGGAGENGWELAETFFGPTYGVAGLTELMGGSGGSGAHGGTSTMYAGGGGGGSIGLYAVGTLTVSGKVDCSGGSAGTSAGSAFGGGGGSGGAILLDAPSIDLSGATLDVSGGDATYRADPENYLGGGGGGGRIAVYTDNAFTTDSMVIIGGRGYTTEAVSLRAESGTIFPAGPVNILSQSGDLICYSLQGAELFVVAENALDYEWQKKNGETWEAIVGAPNASTYELVAPVALSAAGEYRCAVSNSLGTEYTQSITVTVIEGNVPAGANSAWTLY